MDINDVRKWFYGWNAFQMRLAASEPRQHGNGFFQIDLHNGYRLHVWDPEHIHSQHLAVPIHDHRFSFESMVLVGEQHHVTYDVDFGSDAPTHQIYKAIPRLLEDTALIPTEMMVRISNPHEQIILAGDKYSFEYKQFHETPNVDYVVTLLEKTKIDVEHDARILCPVGLQPDNDFTRYDMSPFEQWEVIRKAVERVLQT